MTVVRTAHRDGSGRRARTSRLGRRGTLRGARWIVRSDASRLVSIAAEFLEAEGFERRADGFADTLDSQGSEWSAAALEIGDEEGSRRGIWRSLFLDDLPIPLPRALHHVIPPTLVIVASRHVAKGVAELVVFPHASRRGDSDYSWAAGPRIARALEGITAAAGAEGAMLSHESLRALPDDGSPASQAVVRDVLGWL
ncbi:hypothetical protein [Microbacterium foliorum]|uniref:hypothetical protein n=1 Tax=Microbacterium foliorum TaxID=104336 RepID=UPI0028D67694|nr:hypothetical protein [Microbacterium foliorum]